MTSRNIVRDLVGSRRSVEQDALVFIEKINVEQAEVYPVALKIHLNCSLTIDWKLYQGVKKFRLEVSESLAHRQRRFLNEFLG